MVIWMRLPVYPGFQTLIYFRFGSEMEEQNTKWYTWILSPKFGK